MLVLPAGVRRVMDMYEYLLRIYNAEIRWHTGYSSKQKVAEHVYACSVATLQSRSHPTGSPIYAIHFLFQRWRHESWIRELERVCKKRSRSHKKQLERANRSQFNGTGASSGVEAVNTRITATRTQKQEKFDDSIYCESIWHISFRHDCRLWHQYVTVVHR